jgi:lipoprotein-anchoring transpeptidase ErfK/SrfK
MVGHSRGRRRAGTRTLAGLIVLVAGVALTACGSTPSAQFLDAQATPSPTAPRVPSALTASVDAGAANVSPGDPVVVTLTAGTLGTVVLTPAGGQPIAGAFADGQVSWRNTAQLVYNKAYTLTITGDGADGKHYEETRSFTTVKPARTTGVTLRANDGMLLNGGTFGVGQPVVVYFDRDVVDKAAAERKLSVTTTPAGVVGGWYWMGSREVHWRPQAHWPAGTKVTVTAGIYGRDLGSGSFGAADKSASFTIGREKIAVADSSSHRMKIYMDGSQVTTINGHDVTAGIPISMGKGGTERQPSGVLIDFTTNSGPHVITQKFEVVRMSSASYGITDPESPNFYDEQIRKAVQISGDGEYVHLRDWTVSQIGNVNTSHGCVNVGVQYIYWFYDNFGAGDIVDVTGTNRQLDKRNGLGDWVVSWDDWLKGSALPH